MRTYRSLAAVLAFAGSSIVLTPGSATAQNSIVPTARVVAPAADRGAKDEMPSVADVFRSLPDDFRRLGRNQNLFLAGLGAAGAATVHSWDTRVARSDWGGGAVHQMLRPGQVVGSFLVQTTGSFGTFALGRLTGQARLASVGAKVFRAQMVAQGATQFVKFTTRRTRPDGSTLSFPSGHTSSAFATATVLHGELGWKAGVPAYAVATWIAASRVQMDRHYLSDVVAGATVGLLAGRAVTVGRGATRFAVSPMAVPGGIGANFVHVSSR
jgi:membrane-associated phospholipid phosphatase